jgi:hypothetical protein
MVIGVGRSQFHQLIRVCFHGLDLSKTRPVSHLRGYEVIEADDNFLCHKVEKIDCLSAYLQHTLKLAGLFLPFLLTYKAKGRKINENK